MMGFRHFHNMVVIVIAAAACASVITATIIDNEKRISEDNKTTAYDESSQLHDKIISKNLSTISSSKHEKKMIQRLIGGHVKHQNVIESKKERETWDDGMMMSSAGNGKEKTRRDDDEEEKKTLSQQVKEGKYGLIQNEIYPTQPKRPGIISYLGNPEVPKDTRKNYGGLEEEEIWLAENHLLVLRGGRFPDHVKKPVNNEANWPPIDDYKAPSRQVKIPNRPEVPPPFPVQLAEGGPVQIIRANGSVSNVNDTADYDEYANYPEGFYPGEAPFYPAPSNASDLGPANSSGGSYPGAEGAVGPFYPALPPGAVYLPAPSNQSEYEDEDQSIYYPPPYSFYYQHESNATPVPPGPLVPGIILPPPPNFFASLDEEKKPKARYERPQTTTTEIPETTTYPQRRKTTKPYKTRLTTTTTTTTTTTRPKPLREFITSPPPRITSTPRYVETTTSRPDKPTTILQTDYYDVRTDIENHLVDLGAPQEGQWSAIVGSTAVPLLAYYATTSSPAERTRSTGVARGVEVKSNGDGNAAKNQASYYYYEETNDEVVRKTTTPATPIYFKTSTESPSPYYNVEPIVSSHRKPKKQYYNVEMIPSQQTSNNFDVKLNYNGYNQAQDNLRNSHGDNGQRYYQPPPATTKPYYTTQRPRYYYQTSQNQQQQYDYRDDELKSNPVYQYSYETTDYANKGNQESYQNQEIREDQGVYDYQQPPIANSQYYDYETQPVVDKVQKPDHNRYLNQRIVNTTPNPQHAYYTKQDEQLLDDVTKQYFTIFGKKLAETVLPSTTPLYRVVSTTTETPINHVNTYVPSQYNVNAVPQPVQHFKPPKVKVHYGDQTQRPFSLEGDTLVNYKNPLPPINPDAEFISVPNKPQRQRPGNYVGNTQRDIYRGGYRHPGPTTISLANDIAVNYRDPRPPINPDAEFINPTIQGQLGSQGSRGGGGGSYFAYQLPGNGGHFYFLTPQAISQREDINGGRYLYSKPTPPRIIRRRRGQAGG